MLVFQKGTLDDLFFALSHLEVFSRIAAGFSQGKVQSESTLRHTTAFVGRSSGREVQYADPIWGRPGREERQ